MKSQLTAELRNTQHHEDSPEQLWTMTACSWCSTSGTGSWSGCHSQAASRTGGRRSSTRSPPANTFGTWAGCSGSSSTSGWVPLECSSISTLAQGSGRTCAVECVAPPGGGSWELRGRLLDRGQRNILVSLCGNKGSLDRGGRGEYLWGERERADSFCFRKKAGKDRSWQNYNSKALNFTCVRTWIES